MTTLKEFYYILTFNTTTDAMCADKCAKENTNGIRAALMPLPQEFKSGCGFALRFLDDNLEAILKFCKTSPFHGKLFKDNQISKIFVLWKDLEEKDFIFEDHEVSEVIWMEFEKCYQAVKNNKINHCIYLEELDMIGEYLRECQE